MSEKPRVITTVQVNLDRVLSYVIDMEGVRGKLSNFLVLIVVYAALLNRC